MQIGTVVAGRFALESIAGSGGMGTVFRATDSLSGVTVALKVLHEGRGSDVDAQRFLREGRVLSDLAHPAIVGYVAHGIAEGGEPFLAMEWLEGEDLARRLERGPLPVPDAIAVIRAAAAGIATAHALGIVHRDIKPANLFLVGGDPRRVKVLDFGIARRDEGSWAMTRTGAVMGTAGYMAPEQARGLRDLDARADVFALGCVLYESLTGRAAFGGDHFVAVLAKVLLDEPPRLRDLAPAVPAFVDALVARMLTKDPALRPRDAAAVVEALGDASTLGPAEPTSIAPMPAVTSGELRLVSVILVARPPATAADATLLAAAPAAEDAGIRALAEQHGANLASLADGTLLLALSGRGGAADQAARAAACARAVGALVPDARIALATGRAETGGAWPVGPVIDRAATILTRGLGAGDIGVDELTARLLEARDEVSNGLLRGPRAEAAGARTLLGRPTPCVARDKEIALLEATLGECIEEPAARAAVIIAPPGIGKSRLVHEFLGRVRASDAATVLVARMDPVSAGSALAIARQLVGSATSAPAGETVREPLTRIRARVEPLGLPEADRVIEFLAELIGVRAAREPSPRMRAARGDAGLMGEWIRRSFLEWLSAECARKPMLVVIEDLHWGDGASVGYLDGALGANAERPLMVLATGRPETTTLFPDLWAASGAQMIRLAGLPRRAAERLARMVLGDEHADAELARIVDRADGNAFYLEELIRAVVENESAELPETVLAMAQARLDALEPDGRRVLRAASVFGERFWRTGVAALLGDVDATEWLSVLTRREVLVRSESSRFATEDEYVFRHGLLREAAYASLPASEIATAHRCAGEWLERAGEREARVLAEHFQRGGTADRAIHWLRRAALTALNGRDFPAANRLAARALEFDPAPAIAGGLYVIQGMTGAWTCDFEQSRILSARALPLVEPGSTAWYAAASGLAFAASRTGRTATALEVARAVLARPERVAPSGAYANAMFAIILAVIESGEWEVATALLTRLRALEATTRVDEHGFRGWLRLAGFLREVYAPAPEDLTAVRGVEEAIVLFEAAGDPGGRLVAAANQLLHTTGLGGGDAAVARMRDELSRAQPLELTGTMDWGMFALARSLVYLGRTDEALEAVRLAQVTRDLSFATLAMGVRALAFERAGSTEAALGAAHDALERGTADVSLATRVWTGVAAHAIIARHELRSGRGASALDAADRAVTLADGKPCFAIERHAAFLARAEALSAVGRTVEAATEIRALRQRLLATAATAPDEVTRERYLTHGPHVARAFELAAAWCGDA